MDEKKLDHDHWEKLAYKPQLLQEDEKSEEEPRPECATRTHTVGCAKKAWHGGLCKQHFESEVEAANKKKGKKRKRTQ